MTRTVYITIWRVKDGDVWNEAGSHTTYVEAAEAGDKLKAATGLQTSVLQWVDSAFQVLVKMA